MPTRDAIDALPPRRAVTDFVTAPHRLAMGLSAIPDSEPWLELDSDLPTDLRLKRQLFAERRDEVLVELPASREAQREVREIVIDALCARFPDLYSLETSPDEHQLHVHAIDEAIDLRDDESAPLEHAARCVQEDLCVMEKGRSETDWCLTAGAVCFPTRWRLQPQLGRPMVKIHGRVPGYREQLDRRANTFFDGMSTGTVHRRGNWSLLDDPTLFQSSGKLRRKPREGLDARNAGQKVWLRIEHQTLQRLPRSDAILFGIRVHRTRLDDAALDPVAARTLREAIDTMAPAMQLYKSLALVRDATVGYLDARLARET